MTRRKAFVDDGCYHPSSPLQLEVEEHHAREFDLLEHSVTALSGWVRVGDSSVQILERVLSHRPPQFPCVDGG